MTRKQKKMLRRILAAAVLLIAALFVPVEGLWKLPVFLIPYFIIGWDILSIITLGVLSIWLTPYKQATFADFYREISDTRPKPETDDFYHFDPADTAA